MTANIKHCAIHSYYSGGFDACPECSNPRATLTSVQDTGNVVTVVRRKQSRAKGQIAPSVGGKPLSATEVSKRLQVAGLTVATLTADDFASGAVSNALYGTGTGDSEGAFLAYMALCRQVGCTKYRNRMVSGAAA